MPNKMVKKAAGAVAKKQLKRLLTKLKIKQKIN